MKGGPPAQPGTPPGYGVELGVGLTGLGRPWGRRSRPVPTAGEAARFLARAVELGVRVFDTAPSYGRSEARLGTFLKTLPEAVRQGLFVATKCGEQWDEVTGTLSVRHDYEALAASIDRSLERLGGIDLLQLHRSTPESLRSAGVRRAFAYARASGVRFVGASVSSPECARIAIEEVGVAWIQFPYHAGNDYMEPAFARAEAARVAVLVNRPLGMGELAPPEGAEEEYARETLRRAFAYLRRRLRNGVVLSGTVSAAHLRMNIEAFAAGASSAP